MNSVVGTVRLVRGGVVAVVVGAWVVSGFPVLAAQAAVGGGGGAGVHDHGHARVRTCCRVLRVVT